MASNLYDNLELILKKELPSQVVKDQLFHAEKVHKIALSVCEKLQIHPEEKNLIAIAAMLHDLKKYDSKGQRVSNYQQEGSKYLVDNLAKLLPDEFPAKQKAQNKKDLNLIGFMVLAHRKAKVREQAQSYKFENKDLERTILLSEIVRGADIVAKVYRVHQENLTEARQRILEKLNELDNNLVVLYCLEEYIKRYFKIYSSKVDA